MEVAVQPDQPVTDAEYKKATGNRLRQWFKERDAAEALHRLKAICEKK